MREGGFERGVAKDHEGKIIEMLLSPPQGG
jgi:hypothetical protein